jgi:hypothetical protein
MRNLILRIAVSSKIFFLGSGVFVFVFFYLNFIPEIAAPNLLPVQKKEICAESKTFPGLSQKISELKKGKSGYFPKDKFSVDWAGRDDFINDWYGKHLKAMGEKSLLDVASVDNEIYRFLWLRSFHHPIFVRIERSQNDIKLFTKELDGAGGYEPGKVLRSKEIVLKREDFCKFLTLLEKADYWNLPIEKDDTTVVRVDGAEWILEGVKSGRYHIVDRWSPKKGEYRKACLYLLKLSGVDLDRLKSDLY